ncbi:hypothetical protein [Anatilimnocola floriformis]|uniref:hypothetical protein n=1 Tax=Anatilimnocola floriformis TaxID=2948575 RepID=UPI0020C3950A|nr:hypothetical protein [Anatilimnocola floriformis]
MRLCMRDLSGMLLGAALLLTGCGASDGTVKVTGQVMFQDQPIPEGEILFTPADGKTASVAAKIEQGKFICEVPTGPVQVSVTAFRAVPGKFDLSNPGQQNPLLEMYIPPQFNSKTQLRAEISSANKDLEFKL